MWGISEDGESRLGRILYQKGKEKEERQNTNFLQSNQITNPTLPHPQISNQPAPTPITKGGEEEEMSQYQRKQNEKRER